MTNVFAFAQKNYILTCKLIFDAFFGIFLHILCKLLVLFCAFFGAKLVLNFLHLKCMFVLMPTPAPCAVKILVDQAKTIELDFFNLL